MKILKNKLKENASAKRKKNTPLLPNEFDKLGSDISSSEDELLTGEPSDKLTYSPVHGPPGVGSSENDDKVMIIFIPLLIINKFCLFFFFLIC